MSSGKGNIVLLTIISVLTLLVSVAGATFAFHSAIGDDANEGSTTIEVSSGTIATNFSNGNTFNGSSLAPGAVIATKNFTVEGDISGSSNLNYELELDVTNNTFSDGALVYTISSTNTNNNGTIIAATSSNVAIPNGASKISLGKGLFAGPTNGSAVHTYKVTVTYVNTGLDQSADASAAFNAKLSVVKSAD